MMQVPGDANDSLWEAAREIVTITEYLVKEAAEALATLNAQREEAAKSAEATPAARQAEDAFSAATTKIACAEKALDHTRKAIDLLNEIRHWDDED